MDTDGLPSEVDELGPLARPLLALCRELARLSYERGDDGEFFLACRDAAIALGRPTAFQRCHRLLTGEFPRRDWLQVGPTRSRKRANRYRYLLSDSP